MCGFCRLGPRPWGGVGVAGLQPRSLCCEGEGGLAPHSLDVCEWLSLNRTRNAVRFPLNSERIPRLIDVKYRCPAAPSPKISLPVFSPRLYLDPVFAVEQVSV